MTRTIPLPYFCREQPGRRAEIMEPGRTGLNPLSIHYVTGTVLALKQNLSSVSETLHS
jgi:hypothetical protein